MDYFSSSDLGYLLQETRIGEIKYFARYNPWHVTLLQVGLYDVEANFLADDVTELSYDDDDVLCIEELPKQLFGDEVREMGNIKFVAKTTFFNIYVTRKEW